MARIKIDIPNSWHFTHQLSVRVTDLNYGNHLANNAILELVHEARVRFFHSLNQSELEFFGSGLIMADCGIEFKAEAFMFENISISVAVADIQKAGFDLVYQLKKDDNTIVANVKTAMVFFNYENKRVQRTPQDFITHFSS